MASTGAVESSAYASCAREVEVGQWSEPEAPLGRPWRRRLALALALSACAGVALLGWRHGAQGTWQSGATTGLAGSPTDGAIWSPDSEGKPVDVKVLTYNTYWWNLYGRRGGAGGIAGHLIAASSKPPYDVMGFQECEDPWRVLSDGGILDDYTPIVGAHGIAMAFRNTVWKLLAKGMVDVAEDKPGPQSYGKRGAQWMRLQHFGTNRTMLFVNHHGPLPIDSGGAWGGWTTAGNILNVIRQHGKRGDAVILVGDFNAGMYSQTVQALKAKLHHVFSGDFFSGIDNIFSNIKGNVVSTANLGQGGSDHDALSAVIRMGPPQIEPMKTPTPVRGHCGRVERNARYVFEGGWHTHKDGLSLEHCILRCQDEDRCRAWTWKASAEQPKEDSSRCWMMGGEPEKKLNKPGLISGLSLRDDRGKCHCHCSWAKHREACDVDDGSCCWQDCCGGKATVEAHV